MNTQLCAVTPEAIGRAAALLQRGEIVAIPTETVYGLAANALSDAAVKKIFEAKGRPQDNPLISHISSADMLPLVAAEIPESALKLASAFWPGPLTMILPRSSRVADSVCAGLPTAAVRMPSHPAARAVIEACGFPLAAPSANLSGKPSPTNAADVLADMDGRIPMILDGGECEVGVESTVVSLAGPHPVLLRPGHVTKEDLERVLGVPVEISDAVMHRLGEGETAASPGMKYKHYAPKAQVIIVKGPLEAYRQYVRTKSRSGDWCLCFSGEEQVLAPMPCVAYGAADDDDSQAHALFSALRELDAHGAQRAFARCPHETGVALAVYNRLLRAAAFRVVEL